MREKPLQFIQVNPEDITYILGLLSMQHPVSQELQGEFYKHAIAIQLQEGQHLLRQGDKCNYMYFIREGAMMAYSLHKHKKITTYISVENEFVSSLSGLYGTQPSREAIVAIEPTLVLGVHTDILQDWYKRFFDLNYIIRQVYEDYYRDAQERTHVVRVGNASERYHYFVKSKPGYIDRLPLECIASFLDMKPETLSRIKKQNKLIVQDTDTESLFQQVEQFMQTTECFKEKTIKVHSLAARLGIPAYKLSLALNTYAKTNFKDFVNQYRISYIKAQLEKEEFLQSFTIEALALQAGFTSRSGFYKAFKKMEGISPKEYMAFTKISG
ncbi:helix-turn-helix domain-containing protein [Pontibacter sp. BT310]|uniref:Helix-turn-helix domain-containing protein n=1 Tax=Pontibacter populi TaxID=890055 RepID=A0ABS6X8B3_9BACT|nr:MULTISPECIES: helix-turn-helix domain-containing protein [Pontibacter]MBJ6116557.1 helix-turn-helix domain-containing protein [Pontibacter sp. BT310]MBR0568981.1 helix-turn-helix domain-containing protein [Microvirga sp. STS03]MBW3363410.1 helix-turn-helix domain-containing protein [Pontibacter populi]